MQVTRRSSLPLFQVRQHHQDTTLKHPSASSSSSTSNTRRRAVRTSRSHNKYTGYWQSYTLYYTNIQKRNTAGRRCHSCHTTETPEWRRGPDGARTLCNACGLRKYDGCIWRMIHIVFTLLFVQIMQNLWEMGHLGIRNRISSNTWHRIVLPRTNTVVFLLQRLATSVIIISLLHLLFPAAAAAIITHMDLVGKMINIHSRIFPRKDQWDTTARLCTLWWMKR